MHLYWRVMEELKEMGEVLVFKDPRFTREYRTWMRKNRVSLAYLAAAGSMRTTRLLGPN